ncbi:MAG: hypothetical protein WC765_05745 [Phycisphaerae bacterium]
MKKTYFLCSYALMLLCTLFLTACQESVKKERAVEVIVEDSNQFPEFLVGRWKAEGNRGWEFVFERNGTISSIVHTLGTVHLKPNEITTVPMKMDGQSIYEPGKWVVDYEPTTNILTVEIDLKSFYLEIGTGTVEGSCSDIFTGPISENKLIWRVNWVTFLNAMAHTPENPSTDLSSDPIYGESQDIIFNKVE